MNIKYAVEAKNITKDYMVGSTVSRVLDDVCVEIESGEFAAIMGPSGSGKSTLLYILGGLENPTRGSILVNGSDILKFSDKEKSIMRRRKIGFVFQFYNLIPNLNVAENILLPVLLDGKKTGDYKRQLEEILEVAGLGEKRSHRPHELSGGQQQRVAIARALLNDPEIIFADEPTGNLDSRTGTEILSLLRRINREKGKTILMVTHSREAAGYGSRIIYVHDGKVSG